MRRLWVLAAVGAALAAPAAALAHPLGNFTVNRYSRVEVSGSRVYVVYVLDMAEIPAFQERRRIDDRGVYASALARRIGAGLELRVAGHPLALRPVRHVLAFPPGSGGLRTLRFEALYASRPLPRGPAALSFRDRNYEGRIGWREVVVRAAAGARVVRSSAPARSLSRELLAYPQDLLSSPPDVSAATARIVAGRGPGVPPELLAARALGARASVRQSEAGDHGFAALVSEHDLTVGFVLLSLVLAMFWGAAHAFSPGHGKAIVAAYLVGSRGTPRHALLLGLIVTVTHTIGVFALGLVTLALSEFVLPERLYPWLNLASALLVIGVGIGVLRWRLADWLHARAHARGRDDHHHERDDHSHGHGGHSHHHFGRGGLLGVGISGGIIPCPTALVVLLAAISLHRIGYGLVLILAFSVGLAAAMTGIGLLALTARRALGRRLEGRWVRALPAVSAAVILLLGVAMTVRALPEVA